MGLIVGGALAGAGAFGAQLQRDWSAENLEKMREDAATSRQSALLAAQKENTILAGDIHSKAAEAEFERKGRAGKEIAAEAGKGIIRPTYEADTTRPLEDEAPPIQSGSTTTYDTSPRRMADIAMRLGHVNEAASLSKIANDDLTESGKVEATSAAAEKLKATPGGRTASEEALSDAHAAYYNGLPKRERAQAERNDRTNNRQSLTALLSDTTNELKALETQAKDARTNFANTHKDTPATETDRANLDRELGPIRKRMNEVTAYKSDVQRRLLGFGDEGGGGSRSGSPDSSVRPSLDSFSRGAPAVGAPASNTPAAAVAPEQPAKRSNGLIGRAMQISTPFSNIDDVLPEGATRNTDGTLAYAPKAPPRALPSFLR